MSHDFDVVILGGGLAGMAAAIAYGKGAVVLERGTRPGGLVRSVRLGAYWFDYVLHQLYFSDSETASRIRALLGDVLVPSQPESWVETRHGTARFPIQMHLHGLDPAIVAGCLADLAQVTFAPGPAAAHFQDHLLRTFGSSLCELFFFPYNAKMWKRPLEQLAPSGFTWTITHPDFTKAVRGAVDPSARFDAYNSHGWYPRPGATAPLRGMEVLSAALACEVDDLRLEHEVVGIDLNRRIVHTRTRAGDVDFRYRKACVVTIPLPVVLATCHQTPSDLRVASQGLLRNRVVMTAFALRGPRPHGRGHWRYFTDPGVIFNRIIHMHEFDPCSAPADGWGLMAEITEPAEHRADDAHDVLDRVETDLRRTGCIDSQSEIVDRSLWIADPGYVVFTMDSGRVVDAAQEFLHRHDAVLLGRFGRWEYSSMSQVLRDGFAWGCNAAGRPTCAPFDAGRRVPL